mgnify:CR=1 FL=1
MIRSGKSYSYWLARFNRKMSFHFPWVVPLISDQSVWHNGKQPQYNLSPHMSSQPITSRIYQRPIKSLTGVFEFSTDSHYHLTLKIPHRLSKHQSLTTVLLRTPITQMIFFNQGKMFMYKT